MTYEKKFEAFIDAAVRETVGNFSATMFWEFRPEAGEKLKNKINEVLMENHASCEYL